LEEADSGLIQCGTTAQCELCDTVVRFLTIKGTTVYHDSRVTCADKHVVYGVRCLSCDLVYVGFTAKQKLRARIRKHRSEINTVIDKELKPGSPELEAEQFCGPALHAASCPGMRDWKVEVSVLKHLPLFENELKRHTEDRLWAAETLFITKFRTLHPGGLNHFQDQGLSSRTITVTKMNVSVDQLQFQIKKLREALASAIETREATSGGS